MGANKREFEAWEDAVPPTKDELESDHSWLAEQRRHEEAIRKAGVLVEPPDGCPSCGG